MSLTPQQVNIIRSTAPALQEHGNAITTPFYDTVLKEVPDLNNVFNQANQRNNHQAYTLAGTLFAYASHIDDLEALSPAMEEYKVVGEYLLRAMGDVLGAALTKETLDAWGAAYWQLANLKIKREGQLLRDAEGWTDWREFRIAAKIEESADITSLYLNPVDGKKLPFHYLQSRQYSLSDMPNPDYYRVSIEKEKGLHVDQPGAEAHPGFMSDIMHDCKSVGDVIKVSHPAGEFFLDPEYDTDVPILLFSAGVGLTPMISIVNTVVSRNTTSPRRISFIHGARTTAVQAFGKHIRATADRRLDVTASIFIKSPDTRTDVEGVESQHAGRVRLGVLDRSKDMCLDDERTRYFVCGPDGFVADVHQGQRDLGVEDERIRMEVFGRGQVPKG